MIGKFLKKRKSKSIALNDLHVPQNFEEIRHAYKSKHNLSRENQVILLMIIDNKRWHYLVVMKLITSITSNHVGVITSNHVGDFYFLNCLHSYRTKDKLKEYENVCKNHDYCYIKTSNENNKILKCNHGEKSMKAPFIIYSDLESLLEKK